MWDLNGFAPMSKREQGHPVSLQEDQPGAKPRAEEFSRHNSGPLPALSLDSCGPSGYTRRWSAVEWEGEKRAARKANLEQIFRGHAPPNAVRNRVRTS